MSWKNAPKEVQKYYEEGPRGGGAELLRTENRPLSRTDINRDINRGPLQYLKDRDILAMFHHIPLHRQIISGTESGGCFED